MGGRKKIDTLSYIDDVLKRDQAFTKRKRGIIKKCMEFSKMCGLDISLSIYDKNKLKLIQFSSTYDFSPKVVSKLLEPDNLNMLKTFIPYSNEEIEHVTTKVKPRTKQEIEVNSYNDLDSLDEFQRSSQYP